MNQRQVTEGEFQALTCNRCGACCDHLWLPSPLKLVQSLAGTSDAEVSLELRVEKDRFIGWLTALEPTGHVSESPERGATHEYVCTRFQRLADGTGHCTAYEDRPSVCRDFPYGRPVEAEEYPDCSWNVEIFRFVVGERYEGTNGTYVVLWIGGPNLYVRFNDGSEANLDTEGEARRVLDVIRATQARELH